MEEAEMEPGEEPKNSLSLSLCYGGRRGGAATTTPSRKLKILCLHGFRQNASGFKGRTASLAKKLKDVAELVYANAPHKLPAASQVGEDRRGRFAWFVSQRDAGGEGQPVGPADPLQYRNQTCGFGESLARLKQVFCSEGPFDGVLGFSQGAAMAASVCALAAESKCDELHFRFVILCSGFPAPFSGIRPGSIRLPSLHLFGRASANDRQIANRASRDLACSFSGDSACVVEHDLGHIIPTRPPFICKIKDWLLPFQYE